MRCPRPWLPNDGVQPRARPRERVAAGAIAAMATIAVHVLLVESVLMSEGGRYIPRPHQEGLGANAISAEEQAVATLIFIEHPDVGSSNPEPLELAASRGRVMQNLQLTIISPEPTMDLALDDVKETADSKEAAPDDSAGDRQARAELFGGYLGQIQARIQRAWLRPRSPIGEESFECRVQVLQTRRGDVLEITLQRCNGSLDWQASLVHAIESASPLPAPPDPHVFAESLQLSFVSNGFDPAGSGEGFEPVLPIVRASAPLPETNNTEQGPL